MGGRERRELIWNLFTRNRRPAGQEHSPFKSKVRRYIRAIAYIFNIHTLFVLALSILSVFVSLVMDWRWNMDFSLVATGTVFPLTYTISQAYTRRERATVLIANLKASVVALYFMHRDWDQSDNYPASMGNDRSPWALKCKVLLVEMLLSLKKFLTIKPDVFESIAEQRLTAVKHDILNLFEHDVLLSEKDKMFSAKSLRKLQIIFQVFSHTPPQLLVLQKADPSRPYLSECYRCLSMLSVMNEQLTMKSGYTRGGEGGLSRTNQYLRYVMSNIEELRMIKEYRTPAMMRHACSLLFHLFAVILAPYFAHFCDTWIGQGHKEGTCVAGYMGAALYVLIVMLLLHCEQDLEDCFAETGLDDVFFTLHEEVDEIAPNDRVLLRSNSSRCSLSIGGMSPTGSVVGSAMRSSTDQLLGLYNFQGDFSTRAHADPQRSRSPDNSRCMQTIQSESNLEACEAANSKWPAYEDMINGTLSGAKAGKPVAAVQLWPKLGLVSKLSPAPSIQEDAPDPPSREMEPLLLTQVILGKPDNKKEEELVNTDNIV